MAKLKVYPEGLDAVMEEVYDIINMAPEDTDMLNVIELLYMIASGMAFASGVSKDLTLKEIKRIVDDVYDHEQGWCSLEEHPLH